MTGFLKADYTTDNRAMTTIPARREDEAIRETADAVLMVEPAAFAYNGETADTNRFQSAGSVADAARIARAEWGQLADALEAAGVRVCRVPDTASPVKPDAVFPNNWVSFHPDGTVVLYSMQAASRRPERREPVIASVERDLGFRVTRRIDLSGNETTGRFLEGTGSLVLDPVARVAYACRSPRTDPDLAAEWAGVMGYGLELFDAATPDGTPVYHTNVLLWIGSRAAGIGSSWIAARDRMRVLERLQATGRILIDLSPVELLGFAGNALELRRAGTTETVLAMSTTAAAALTPANRERIHASCARVVVAAVPTIERLGGGSVRCMLAEVPIRYQTSQ